MEIGKWYRTIYVTFEFPKVMGWKRDTSIQDRIGYMEGAEQLCLECYKESLKG